MSTRCTIGMGGEAHLYKECIDENVYIQRDSPYEVIRICTDEEWSRIHAGIIQKFLQSLFLGLGFDYRLPEKVWEYSGAGPLDKAKLIKAFAKLVEEKLS